MIMMKTIITMIMMMTLVLSSVIGIEEQPNKQKQQEQLLSQNNNNNEPLINVQTNEKEKEQGTLAITVYEKGNYGGTNYTWYGNKTLNCLKIPSSVHSVHSVTLRYYTGFGIYTSTSCDLAQHHDRYWSQKVPSISEKWTINAISPYWG